MAALLGARYVRSSAAALADHSGGEIDGLLHIPKRPRTGASPSGAAGTRGGASAAGFLMCPKCLVMRGFLGAWRWLGRSQRVADATESDSDGSESDDEP